MLKEQIEDEQESKAEINRNLNKMNGEVVNWRNKYEVDAIQRTEELEDAKKKLVTRLQSAEELVESFQSKCSSLDKTKLRLATEVEDMGAELDRCNSYASQLDKKQRNFDKIIAEHKCKQDELQVDLEIATKEARQSQSELFTLKNATEEALDQLEASKRENKILVDELKEVHESISESNKNLFELEKQKRTLEVQRSNLHTNIEESEAAIESEENKLIRITTDINQRKQDMERRCAEKDDEAEQLRRNGQRTLEALQSNLDIEIRARGDAVRNRKKMEADFNDVEVQLKTANRQADDAQRSMKALNGELKDKNSNLEDLMKQKETFTEQDQVTERRVNLMNTEIEELRMAFEGCERSRKQVETELIESNERANMLHVQNTTLVSTHFDFKRRGNMNLKCPKIEGFQIRSFSWLKTGHVLFIQHQRVKSTSPVYSREKGRILNPSILRHSECRIPNKMQMSSHEKSHLHKTFGLLEIPFFILATL